ncbi:methyltransferase [Xylaria sp. FL1777]|nr:methyltransferase [Xylaria sp. FL1777]
MVIMLHLQFLLITIPGIICISNITNNIIMATVESRMTFLEPWVNKTEEPYVRGKTSDLYPRTNFTNLDYSVLVQDARPEKESFNLDTHGFAFYDSDPPADSIIQAVRTRDRQQVEEFYYPEVEDLVKRKTGASKVIIFDHTYRRRDPSLAVNENPNGREQPATVVHCDQSASGAIGRVRRHAGEYAEKLLRGRAQIINVWRPIHGTVADWPLAVMDYRSLKDSEVHATSIFSQEFDIQGSTVSINYGKDQQWYYLDQQRTDEVTFIKIWDSKDGVAKMCPHCAFLHPQAPANGPLRESVEVRCLVFYES